MAAPPAYGLLHKGERADVEFSALTLIQIKFQVEELRAGSVSEISRSGFDALWRR
jgi:hypothetical protein